MAISGVHPALGRIMEALGLGLCRGFTLSANVDDVVRIQAEQYATGEQLDGVAAALETRDYVLVPREEYDRLVASSLGDGPSREDA